MDARDYLDFDLQMETAPRGFRAHVVNSPVGQASCVFKMPFSDLELENFFLKMAQSRGVTRRAKVTDAGPTHELGGRLFAAVFDEDVFACLRSSIDEADRQGKGLRIRLRLAETPELANLPWEYLYNSKQRKFVSLSIQTPIVRFMELPERIKPLAVSPPLRVLVMISSPSDYQQLDVEQEWTKLREATSELEARGAIVLERLSAGTLEALQHRLRRGMYHIFHFIGHGGFENDDGVLVMETPHGKGRPVGGCDVGTLLHDHCSLRMAILNACEGARCSQTDPFSGVAQSLVLQGIPAVMAMQFEISDQAAISLAHEFYGAVADGYPVDAALAEARKAVFAAGNAVEWGTPVLYLRAPDGRIFDVDTSRIPRPAKDFVAPPSAAFQFCTQCGERIAPGTLYCVNCGAPARA
jgi:CHAT domain